MERSLRARLRSPLGPAFVLIRASWACLIASLALAALGFPGGTLLFALLLVPGWLLTFLLGVMQRIVPFLASVHASTTARGTPLISAMTPGKPSAASARLAIRHAHEARISTNAGPRGERRRARSERSIR